VVEGYEIHMGRSKIGKSASPVFSIVKRFGKSVREADGAVTEDGRVWGTYLHGIFADPLFRQDWLQDLFKNKGIPHPSPSPSKGEGRGEGPSGLPDPYDAWAAHLCRHLDMKKIFEMVGKRQPKRPLWTGKHY
jgi:adenosylcobyric acid synthase